MNDGLSSYNRFLAGDNNGLSDLVEQYNSSLILFINGFVNDLFAAEDIAADTFMEIFLKKGRFKENSSAKFKTWLFKIARNNAIDYLRKQSRTRTIAFDDVGEVAASPNSHGNPEDALLTIERIAQLHRAMSTLSPDYRQILHLIYFEDMGYDNAGKVLKKTNRQIKNLAYNARKSLKAVLEKEGFSYEALTN